MLKKYLKNMRPFSQNSVRHSTSIPSHLTLNICPSFTLSHTTPIETFLLAVMATTTPAALSSTGATRGYVISLPLFFVALYTLEQAWPVSYASLSSSRWHFIKQWPIRTALHVYLDISLISTGPPIQLRTRLLRLPLSTSSRIAIFNSTVLSTTIPTTFENSSAAQAQRMLL